MQAPSWTTWWRVHAPAMLRGVGYTLALLACTLWIVIAALAPVVWKAFVAVLQGLYQIAHWLLLGLYGLVRTGSTGGDATDRQIAYLVDLYRDVKGQEKSAGDFAGWTVDEASAKISELAAQR